MAEVENEQHDVDLTGPNSGESAANAGPAGHPLQHSQAFEPATNSFEQPTSVLPSVETNDMDDAGAPGNADNCELPYVSRNSPTGPALSRSPSVGLAPARRFSQSPPPVFASARLYSPVLSPAGTPAASALPRLENSASLETSGSPDIPVTVCPSTHGNSPVTSYAGPATISNLPRLETRPGALEVCPPEPQHFSSGFVTRSPGPEPYSLVVGARPGEPEPLPPGNEQDSPGCPNSLPRRVSSGPQIPGSSSPAFWTPQTSAYFTPIASRPNSPLDEDEYEWRYSNLDQLLMNAPSKTGVKWGPIGPKRKFRKNKISAYDILSPSNSPSGNRVEKAAKTTPIRRTRSSYAAISRRRRTEASGRIDRTLFRLPDLLSQNETDGGASVTANPTTPQTANPRTAPAADTVHLAHDAPVTGNTPPAGNVPAAVNEPSADAAPSNPPASPGIVRWAFNQVSRRWTNIRDRYAGNHPAEAQTSGKCLCSTSSDRMLTLELSCSIGGCYGNSSSGKLAFHSSQ